MVVRDRVLAKLKVGRQSVGGKAIEAFIKELSKLHKVAPVPKDSPITAESLVNEVYSRHKAGDYVHADTFRQRLRNVAAQCGLKIFQDVKGKNFWIVPVDNQAKKLTSPSDIHDVADFLKNQPLLDAYAKQWQIGDKCSVEMPSGVTVTDAVIASIQSIEGTCKVYIPETESHFLADLADLKEP
jgi:hypothetical protein